MDKMMLLFFVLFSALVGTITYFKTRGDSLDSNDGYFLGGRSLTAKIIAGSLLLTNLSAVSFVGMSAQAYDSNMSVMGWEVGSGITLVLVALFLLPRYLKQGITTIPEFIESRFDKGTKNFVTLLFLISYLVNLLPITLYSGAVAMSQIFNVSVTFNISYEAGIWIMVWLIGIIGSIYAIFGGLKAVAVSDTLNGIALIIGGLAIPIFGIIYIGNGDFTSGFNSFIMSTPNKFNAIGSHSDPVPFATLFTGMLLVNLYYWGTDQAIIQRGLGAKNLKEGQKGIIYAGFLKVLTPILVIIPGIIAFQIFGGDIDNSDLIYSKLVNTVLPKPIVGFFAAAMMGAILSTFNSVLNSASTLFALNIYKPKWGKGKTDEQIVKRGKIFGLISALLAMFVAPFIMNAPNGMFDYLQTINGFFNVPIFTIILMGYLTKRVPPIAAKIGVAFFVFTYGFIELIIRPDVHFLHVSAILFVITCAIMYFIGKSKPMDKEFVLETNNVVDYEPWKNRFRFSGFVIFVMFSMYIVFSPLGIAQDGGMNIMTLVIILALAAIAGVGVTIIEKYFKKKGV
jgi:SSS family solute:Na+ symporter